jgi:hypothetical protein
LKVQGWIFKEVGIDFKWDRPCAKLSSKEVGHSTFQLRINFIASLELYKWASSFMAYFLAMWAQGNITPCAWTRELERLSTYIFLRLHFITRLFLLYMFD